MRTGTAVASESWTHARSRRSHPEGEYGASGASLSDARAYGRLDGLRNAEMGQPGRSREAFVQVGRPWTMSWARRRRALWCPMVELGGGLCMPCPGREPAEREALLEQAAAWF